MQVWHLTDTSFEFVNVVAISPLDRNEPTIKRGSVDPLASGGSALANLEVSVAVPHDWS